MGVSGLTDEQLAGIGASLGQTGQQPPPPPQQLASVQPPPGALQSTGQPAQIIAPTVATQQPTLRTRGFDQGGGNVDLSDMGGQKAAVQLHGVTPTDQSGTGGGQAASTLPFGVPPVHMLTSKPHDVQTGTDVMVQGLPKVAQEEESALEDQGRAELETTEHEAQRKAGEAGLVRGAALDREKQDAETDKKIQAAHDKWMKASDIDPDHYNSAMSTGKRVGLMIAAGLSGMGMGMMGNHGENPINKMIEQETQRDIDSQKNKAAKQHSLYQAAIDQGLSEKQAHALVEKSVVSSGLLGIEASRAADQGPLSAAKTKAAVAQLHEKALDATSRLYGHVQGGTVQAGGIPPEVKKLAAQLQEGSKGSLTPEESLSRAARTLGYDFGGGIGTGWGQGRDQQAHARAIGAMSQWQKGIAEANEGEKSVDEMIDMVQKGGKFDSSRTARGKFLRDSSINSMATIMAAGGKPADAELHMATGMHPNDPNSFQWTGADLTQLQQAKAWYQRKRAQFQASMEQLGKDPFSAPTDTKDVAADTGAQRE